MAIIAQFQNIIKDIKAKSFKPVYFLEGEEAYFIDEIAHQLEHHVLTEAEKAFNYQVFYGRDSNMLDVLTAAKRFPMMSSYQLIVVREAQYLKGLDELLPYLEQVVPTTVLVFLYKNKKVSKATKLGKALKKNGLFTSAKIYERDLMPWMQAHLKESGLTIEPSAAQLLVHTFGADLQKLVGELDKAKANMGDKKVIMKEDIARAGGIDKDYNVFELTKHIGNRNVAKCLEIVKYFEQNPKENPFVVVLINLFNYFKKVHQVHFQSSPNSADIARVIGVNPYFAGEYITASRNFPPARMSQIFEILHEYDLKSKGVGATNSKDGELLTEMVVRILK